MVVSFFSCTSQVPKANLKTDIDSLSYAFGVQVTQGLEMHFQDMELNEAEVSEFFKGFLEGIKIDKENSSKKLLARTEGERIGTYVANEMFNNINANVFDPSTGQSLNKSQYLAGFIAAARNKNALFSHDDATFFVETKRTEVQAKANEPLIAENQAFLDENKNLAGVITLPSGLQYKVEREGRGPKPTAQDEVKVNYKGTDIHGDQFDDGEGVSFNLSHVIAGWTEGIQQMTVGSKYTFYVPYNLGYGAEGYPPYIQPFATLIFEVELLEIVK
jgi:FKBP-type peptidyl-prolyl cis-trans isomerase FklB